MNKPRFDRRDVLIGLLLVAVTLAVYWQVVGFEFTNIDDDYYVESNRAVQEGVNSRTAHWALVTHYQANWHPLTWISLMADTELAKIGSLFLDVDLGKNGSGFYHLANMILHLANVVLLFVVLNVMTGRRWPSAFVAALFAVHPLHVESVVWIAERKDVLSTLFWLLTMLAYVRYVKKPGSRSYLWLLAAFVLGLMSKPMLVSLPIVLLLLDLWPLGRLQVTGYRLQGQHPTPDTRHLILEKLPLFALALASCAVTVWAQRSGGAMATLQGYPLGVRLANAAVAYVAYLWKMIWPSNLTVLYLHPGTTLPMWQVVLSLLGLIAATVLALRAARTRPYVTVGWLWYLITLIPVIGLVQVGKQAMADRYTYIPLIGIFIIIAWGVPDLLGRKSPRVGVALGVAGCVIVAALAVAAYPVVGMWRDSITLFTRAAEIDPTNSLAYNNIGNAMLLQGEADKSVAYLRKALKHHPEYTDAQYNLGNALYAQGNIDGAMAQYKRVLKTCPTHVQAHNNLGGIYAQQGKYDLAIREFEAALKTDPTNAATIANVEKVRGRMGTP